MRIDNTLNRVVAASCLTGVLLVAGCGDANRNRMADNSSDSMTTSGELAGTIGNDVRDGDSSNIELDDAQIVNVALTANRMDSASAAAVVDRLTNTEVQAFARKLMTEHGNLSDSMRTIATRLGGTSSGNQISTTLEQYASQRVEGTGASLDRTYIQNAIAMHQQLLRTLDESLLPQVRDASLRSLLDRMRTSVSAHLQDAENIRMRLGSN